MSFQASSRFHPLAQIYLARSLDPCIEIARAVADDFVRRPHLYSRVPDELSKALTNMRALTGKHPEWPDAAQRDFSSRRVVARTCQGFGGIRLAAIQMVRPSSKAGEPIARVALFEAAASMRAAVEPLEGAALSAIERANSGMLQRAYAVLGSESVSQVFGIAKIPDGDWPKGIYSGALAYLCESVSQTLDLNPEKKVIQPLVAILQRAGYHGAATIDAALDPSLEDAPAERVGAFVQAALGWASALRDLFARVNFVRAWREPEYRRCLQCLERDLLPPHPSGEIDLEGTVRTSAPHFAGAGPWLAFSTETVAGEICCCTGDLYCGANTNGQCDLSDDCPTLTTILT
jgi:mersacidin/lichenicidin family type 2 lantibiotic